MNSHSKTSLEHIQLNIDPRCCVRFIFYTLVAVSLTFFLADIVINYNKLTQAAAIRRLFNMAKENSLSAWFASTQTLFTGLLLWMIVLRRHWEGYPRIRLAAWGLIALFFTYMAVDDAASVHERIGTAFDEWGSKSDDPSKGSDDGFFPSYSWQLILGPFFVTMGFFILAFLWQEFQETDLKLMTFLALAFFGCAMGLDFIEGMEGAHKTIASTLHLKEYTVSHFQRIIEELFELLGTVFFIRVFLTHLLKDLRIFEVRIQ